MTGTRPVGEVLDSPEFFRRILAIADDAVLSVDEDHRIILFNEGAEKIFGWRADEIIGQPLNTLLPQWAGAPHTRHMHAFAAGEAVARPMRGRGIRGRRRDGGEFPAEASISRIDVGGRTVFTAILRDVTAARRIEEDMRRLNADLIDRAVQLENANRELEAFSYSVSHDLRAPLRSISGFAQLLVEDFADTVDDEAKDFLRRIEGASTRMAELIDDLLALSRLTRGDLMPTLVDLSAIAREVVDEIRRADPGRARVTVEIEDGMTAVADSRLMRTAVVNLMDNAWKYTSRNDSARISFTSGMDAEGQRVFTLRDDGAGFDMAYADKLFGAFQRLHGTGEFPGSGIGLATVQRIVHKHGGRVWAEGAVGKGAAFHFTLGEREGE